MDQDQANGADYMHQSQSPSSGVGDGSNNLNNSNEANGINNNEAKRAKLDGGNNGANASIKPSRVIHIRNIPSDVTEAEIIHLGIPFGRVTNVLVLKGKNQVTYKSYWCHYSMLRV